MLTLAGGTAGSIGLTWLELEYRAGAGTPNVLMRNILLGIGASFIAAGFISWGLLYIKEVFVSLADWIREATERRRQRILEAGRQQGRKEAFAELGLEPPEDVLLESPRPPENTSPRNAYLAGYEDAQRGRPLGSRRDIYLAGYQDAQRGRPLNPPDSESQV